VTLTISAAEVAELPLEPSKLAKLPSGLSKLFRRGRR
jgi:hypothetical protein